MVVAAAPSPPLPGGGACLGTSDAVVRDQAACQGACQAQLAGSSSEGVAGAALSPEMYAGEGTRGGGAGRAAASANVNRCGAALGCVALSLAWDAS